MNDIVSFKEAIEYLGVSDSTLRRLCQNGEITVIGAGARHNFLKEDLQKLKGRIKPDGLTHAEIAERFAISRQSVERRFKQYHVKPCGLNRYGGHLYDEKTVKYFTSLFGWVERPPESQKDESQNPPHA